MKPIKDRIIETSEFNGGTYFTVAEMLDRLDGVSKGGVASALKNMETRCEILVKSVTGTGGPYNVYKKPPPKIPFFSIPLVSTPTSSEFTPGYC